MLQHHLHTSTLRLLCSITSGQNQAIWKDVSGSTPLAFVRDSVTFTTTVSTRFWLMDCRHINEVSRLAAKLYSYMSQVPFMVKFVVFAKWLYGENEAKISIFCMTDDKEDKTLEQKEGYQEIAKSRDVEILENQFIYSDLSGNLLPILKSGEQLNFEFCPFRENRLQFTLHVKDQHEPDALLYLLNSATQQQQQINSSNNNLPNKPICVLGINLIKKNEDTISTTTNNIAIKNDDYHILDAGRNYRDLINAKYKLEQEKKLQKQSHKQQQQHEEKALSLLNTNDNNDYDDDDIIHLEKFNISLKYICNLLNDDWQKLAHKLNINQKHIDLIKSDNHDNNNVQQAIVMLRLWLREQDAEDAGNKLDEALLDIQREDIVKYLFKNANLQKNHHQQQEPQLDCNNSIGISSLNGNYKEKDIINDKEPAEKAQVDDDNDRTMEHLTNEEA